MNSPLSERVMVPKSVETRKLENGAVELRKRAWLTEQETELVQSEQVWTLAPRNPQLVI